jgi:hypothetical protein
MFLALLNVYHTSEGFSFRLFCHPVRSAGKLKDFCYGDVMQDWKALAENIVLQYHSDFYLCVLHPVAYLSNWFFMTPSIAGQKTWRTTQTTRKRYKYAI